MLRNSVCFYDAVAHFNIGSKAAVSIINKLGMVPGNYFLEGMKETDKERIAKGNFKNKENRLDHVLILYKNRRKM